MATYGSSVALNLFLRKGMLGFGPTCLPRLRYSKTRFRRKKGGIVPVLTSLRSMVIIRPPRSTCPNSRGRQQHKLNFKV